MVSVTDYGALAEVYEWLISDARLTPAGFVATFDDVIEPFPTAAAVLDCACGTGQLAVGLAGLGMQVVATDASEAMFVGLESWLRSSVLRCGRFEPPGMSCPATSTTPASTWCSASATRCTMRGVRAAGWLR